MKISQTQAKLALLKKLHKSLTNKVLSKMKQMQIALHRKKEEKDLSLLKRPKHLFLINFIFKI